MRHLFIADPLPLLSVAADTTIAFMREAARRGHEIHTAEVQDLTVAEGGRVFAGARATKVGEGEAWFELGAPSRLACQDFDVVWMRKDPPVDLAFVRVCQLLCLIRPPTLVVNDPRGLLELDEKLFALRFPDLVPESFVSRHIAELLAFREHLGGEMIVKPIGGCGGAGVFRLGPGDPNVRAVLELATQQGTQLQMAQRYVPEVREGDKRIIVLEGEPIGAVLRVPRADESRANFHVGGTAARAPLTDRDREICARLRPELERHGVLFAGIDVIGRYLTEINVTSPTGVREINRLEGSVLEARVLDAVERRVTTRPTREA